MATRKGLFSFVRGPGGEGWATERVSFLGDAVSMVFHDTRDGAQGSLYAAAQPEGQVETFSDGKPWPWRVEQIWALERGAVDVELWCETIGGGLFRSRDRAASWELSRSLRDHPQRKAWLGSGADLPGIHSICLHPQDARSSMIGVSCGGVWRTNDDGASWERSADGMFADYMPPNLRSEPSIQDPHRIVQCPSAIDRVWCQHHNGVFRSDDGGRTWNEVANVKPAVFGFAVAIHPTDPDTAWLIPAVEDETRVPVDAKVVVARARRRQDVAGARSWSSRAACLRSRLPSCARRGREGRSARLRQHDGRAVTSENGGDEWMEVSAHLPPVYAVRFS